MENRPWSVARSACVLLFAAAAAAQKAPAKPSLTKVQGCVSKMPGRDRYVLKDGNRCLLLSGTFPVDKIVDHVVTLNGILLEPTDTNPLMFHAEGKVVVGESCLTTCTPDIPGARGLHPSQRREDSCSTLEMPGRQGGTPGAVPDKKCDKPR